MHPATHLKLHLTSLVCLLHLRRGLAGPATPAGCGPPPLVPDAAVAVRGALLEVRCAAGFSPEGAHLLPCRGGRWAEAPRCAAPCAPPPPLADGSRAVDRAALPGGRYATGAVATYVCRAGLALAPRGGELRVCERGAWTGARVACRRAACAPPRDLADGYVVHEDRALEWGDVGQRLHYNCKPGYALVGSHFQLCLEDGSWSPRGQPECVLLASDDPTDRHCATIPPIEHTIVTVIEGYANDTLAAPQTVVEYRCRDGYRNALGACKTAQALCHRGAWAALDAPLARCAPAEECEPPPDVANAVEQVYRSTAGRAGAKRWTLGFTEVVYRCAPGYALQGSDVLSCTMNGCWTPEAPVCVRGLSRYFFEVNNLNAVLVSVATGVGVLSLLLVICLIVVCRRRKPLTRAGPISAPIHRDLGDHVTLFNHPDRLALIAFADGIQADQGALPTYDEATRDRTPGLVSTRLHRPHWPGVNLAGRRTRTDVQRHGSFVSHTPSIRSGVDSMGSTDTMAVSEGSTNVTLDTASSMSFGSQPGSCRVHCGSLASFDTSSVINTEGVPLLEESELEELQGGDNLSLVMDTNRENGSLKSNSVDLP